MIAIRGHYYDGRTSKQAGAECRVYDNGAVRIHAPGEDEPLLSLARFDLTASPRLANTVRSLYFPGGQKFETSDNRAVDEIVARFQKRPWLHAVHILETRKRYILICMAAMIAIAWGAARYGVPWTARFIAFRLPLSVVQKVGQETIAILDGRVFKPSTLEAATQARLRAHFEPLIADHPGLNLNVQFRQGGNLGANAFAMPSGTIIFTDEMVKLARHDDELLAVLAHEAGHVARRHGIQRVIQGSLLAFAVMALTGDASGTSQMFLGLPVLLTELGYSREFEREADQYALDYLISEDIPPRRFADLMRRLQKEKKPEGAESEGRWTNYISTHPDTEERLRRFESPQ